MTVETEPTSVGLTADQVLTLLGTWLREQGLQARSISLTHLGPESGWHAGFHNVLDDDLEEWAHALGESFRIASNKAHWWRALTAASEASVDGIQIGVYTEHHPLPVPPELAAGDQL